MREPCADPARDRVERCHNKDVTKMYKPSLLTDIICSWAKFNFFSPTSKQQILDQVIWLNSHIKENNKVLEMKKWIQKGIIYMSDIVVNNECMTCEQMIQKYGSIVNIIDYMRIKKAIPKEWFRIIKLNIEIETEKSGSQRVGNEKKCSKIVYESLVCKIKRDNLEARLKWEERLLYEIPTKKWLNLYKETKKLTLCTKLRFFQYRLMNNYLITNCRMSKWSKNVSPLCTFCQKEDETVIHLLCLCPMVKKLWEALKRWLYYFCFLPFAQSDYEILFNQYKDSFPDMVNVIILITKQYIYAQRCLNNKLNFNSLLHKIVRYRNAEVKLAKKDSKLYEKIKYKWCMFDMV